VVVAAVHSVAVAAQAAIAAHLTTKHQEVARHLRQHFLCFVVFLTRLRSGLAEQVQQVPTRE
jgi:sulfur relay (sulfurtransferase) DsrC/TusE family protein